MSAAAPGKLANRLLARLPHRDHEKFLAKCDLVDLVFGDVLCEQDGQSRHAYFPVTGIISLVALLNQRQTLEMGLIGNEGMLGATVVLDIRTAPLRGLVHGSGTALRISAQNLRRELNDSASLHETVNRYLYVSMAQLSQTAACARFHDTESRLARWLLMTHDRAHADTFRLTHEFLSDMLGVRRSSVTIAAGDLQQRKLIRYTRGEITVVDRNGLEATACQCYRATVDDYTQLLG